MGLNLDQFKFQIPNKLPGISSNTTNQKQTKGEELSGWLSNNFQSIATSAASNLGNLAGALQSNDSTIKTIGAADAGVGLASTALDVVLPGVGTALGAVNALGGAFMANKKFYQNKDISGSAFGGITSSGSATASATSAYNQAGLAGKLFGGSGLSKRIREYNRSASAGAALTQQSNLATDAARGSMGMFESRTQQKQFGNLYQNPNSGITIGKNGMVLQKKEESNGKKLKNVIVNGALHARKHNLTSIKRFKDFKITKKGVPVISFEKGGNIDQQAEVEKNELIINIDLTEKLNKLFQKGDEQSIIEAGKLFSNEIIKNTVDSKDKIIKNA